MLWNSDCNLASSFSSKVVLSGRMERLAQRNKIKLRILPYFRSNIGKSGQRHLLCRHLLCLRQISILGNKRQHICYPNMAKWHYQHHCRYHIRYRKFLYFHHSKTSCDKKYAAACFKITDHRFCTERINRSGE